MNNEEYARMHALETDYWWFAGRRAIVAQLLKSARDDVQTNSPRLLDIGCGTGANLPMLREFVGQGRVVGIDFSPLALQFAQSEPAMQNRESQSVSSQSVSSQSVPSQSVPSQSVSLLRADGLRLPFADDSFDVVTMLDVLEHLSDDCLALREVRRVLRPGGAFVWSVPAYQKLWSAHDEALHHFRRYEFRALQRLMRTQGFAVRRLSFAMSLMPPIAWLWRRLILPFAPRRPRDATRHSEGAVLPQVPPAFNRALVAYLSAEGRIITHRPLRFGTSLVGVAVKQGRRATAERRQGSASHN